MKRGPAHLVLMAALVLVSTSGPFLVCARMDAYAVVFWRMALSALLFLGWAAATGTLRGIPAARVRQMALAALLLTAHFVLWVKAFDLTDFSSNLLLLVMQPVIAAFLGVRLGEPATRDTWISIGLAVVGLAVIAGGDFALGPRALLGDAMCVLGDLAMALFYVTARDARRVTPLPAFMGITLALGSLAMAPVLALGGARLFRYPAASWGWMAALVAFTTVGGHGLMNLAARHVRLFALNVVIVLEPAIGILLGTALLDATVRPLQAAGGIVLGVSVIIGLRGSFR